MSNKHPKSNRPLTCLQDYLNHANLRPRMSDMPPLREPLLNRARNSVRGSPGNNDLLEFVGDRTLNLMSALIVEKMKAGKDHHINVGRVVCTNDTFGRIAFYLRLHEKARLDIPDAKALDDWNPFLSARPPKVLADLFEAYVGAVYLQHGWEKLYTWFQVIFDPIIKSATGDWWNAPITEQLAREYRQSPRNPDLHRTISYYLHDHKGRILRDGQEALDALHPDTVFRFSLTQLEEPHHEKMEIANHLIKMWICKIIIAKWPKYQNATNRAAHIASAITESLVNDFTMSYIAHLLGFTIRTNRQVENGPLFVYVLPPQRKSSRHGELDSDSFRTYALLTGSARLQICSAFKATVGWSYHANPDSANIWGDLWLTPLVVLVHDTLVQRREFRPVLLPDGSPENSLVSSNPSESAPQAMTHYFEEERQAILSSCPSTCSKVDPKALAARPAPVIRLETTSVGNGTLQAASDDIDDILAGVTQSLEKVDIEDKDIGYSLLSGYHDGRKTKVLSRDPDMISSFMTNLTLEDSSEDTSQEDSDKDATSQFPLLPNISSQETPSKSSVSKWRSVGTEDKENLGLPKHSAPKELEVRQPLDTALPPVSESAVMEASPFPLPKNDSGSESTLKAEPVTLTSFLPRQLMSRKTRMSNHDCK